MQKANPITSPETSQQTDMVRSTAERLVSRVGRDAAIRMCRSNMWLGVLAEIERNTRH